VIASLYFIGIALVPLKTYGLPHNVFLHTATVTFILAYLLLFLAVLCTSGFPRWRVYVFTAFALVLAESLFVFIFTLIFGAVTGTRA